VELRASRKEVPAPEFVDEDSSSGAGTWLSGCPVIGEISGGCGAWVKRMSSGLVGLKADVAEMSKGAELALKLQGENKILLIQINKQQLNGSSNVWFLVFIINIKDCPDEQ